MNSIPGSEFSAYHMKCINRFRWTNLSRSIIRKSSESGYFVKPSPFLSQVVFFVYFFNTLGKLIFLWLLVTDHLGPIGFLDRICGFDYLMCGAMVCLSYIIWQRYPLYEVIYRLWEVENRIYQRLGSPREIKWAAEERHSVTVWAHAILTCVGCCSLTIQFYMDPKYCTFTYSLIEMDTPYLRIPFVIHEVLFLSHAWFAMACSNGLCSFEAVNLSIIIKQMGKAVDELAMEARNEALGRKFSLDLVQTHDGSNGNGIENKRKRFGGHCRIHDERKGSNSLFHFGNDEVMAEKRQRAQEKTDFPNDGKLTYSADKTRYNFRNILYDFQQLMLVSEQFNSWVGYKIVALSMIAFCQYISSATMGFQVLRMPGTGLGDIWFYIQDCLVATYVTWRVFDYMSIVLPSSEEFMSSVRHYQCSSQTVGLHLRKFIKSLRPVSLKIGPNPVNRGTVVSAMDMLSNYYLVVALW